MSYVKHTIGKGKKIQVPEDFRLVKRDAVIEKGDQALCVQGTRAWRWDDLLDQDDVGHTPDEIEIDCVIRKYRPWDENLMPDKNYDIIEDTTGIHYIEIPE